MKQSWDLFGKMKMGRGKMRGARVREQNRVFVASERTINTWTMGREKRVALVDLVTQAWLFSMSRYYYTQNNNNRFFNKK